MNLIFLTDDVNASATAYCTLNVCKELAHRGHKVNVISVGQNNNITIKENGNLIINEVKPRKLIELIQKYCKNKTKHKRFIGLTLKYYKDIVTQLKGLFTCKPSFSREGIYIKKAINIIESSNRIDCIIAVVNPKDSLIAASKLNSDYKIPYVAYYLDSLYGNNGIRIMPKDLYKKKVLTFENQYLNKASVVYLMESAKGLYNKVESGKASFINKIKYVDIPLLIPNQSRKYEGKRTHFKDDEFVVLFIGTIPNRIRDPRYTLEVFNKIAKGKINLYLVGRSDYNKEINYYIKQNSNIHFLNYIPHDEVCFYLQEADVLLNIGNSIENMIPSKIFEYMSYKKPIISTTKLTNDICNKYLKEYGNSLIVSESKSTLENVTIINDFIELIDKNTNKLQTELFQQEAIPDSLIANTPGHFCDLFLSHIKKEY